MTKEKVFKAIYAFVTTYDELGDPFPESMLYLASGGNTEDLELINILVQLDIAKRGPGHTLVIGERGKVALENIRKAEREGRI